ncbi:MAG: dipeptidase [Prevotellaceae bacterium]|jgi:acetylornithine deacetylase/succinyl-diaminopimelate desuccinylase-like protein|nr:dipeptidase [Prevotellaceae bacterium]
MQEMILAYIETHRLRFIDELFSLLRIPSISAEAAHKPDMLRAAACWRDALLAAGADRAALFPTAGNPIVYGEKIIDPQAPTVLVYAHYDVMPVDPLDRWLSPPFEPTIRDGKIYARGADDDKGQGFMHAKAFEAMVATGTLPCNVKFMIEGEEEIGSASLLDWCRTQKDRLAADVILVSDTGMISPCCPSITAGLRGLACVEVEVEGPNRDLHSGLYGGAVANPINILCRMIAALHDDDGRIAIPGFYDDVQELSPAERKTLAKAPFNLQEYRQALNVAELQGEKGYRTPEHTGIRPALDVNGIWGGYTGEGSKTVIPAKAFAKLSIRLVPNQDWQTVVRQFTECFEWLAPPSVKVRVAPAHGGQPYVSPLKSVAYRAAERALTQTFGIRPLPFRSGGSIPIIAAFEEILGMKSILMGFGLAGDAIHSPNENYPLKNFFKGIEGIALFYAHFTTLATAGQYPAAVARPPA